MTLVNICDIVVVALLHTFDSLIDFYNFPVSLSAVWRQTESPHPQEVAGDVALAIATSCPPPVCFHLVLPSQHRHAVARAEAELVVTLRLVVPQGVHHAAVHHAHLLLNACQDTIRPLKAPEGPLRSSVSTPLPRWDPWNSKLSLLWD